MATASVDLSNFDPDNLPDTNGMKIGLVVSEWNEEITSALARGAYDTLRSCNIPEENIYRMDVPGTFELPYAAKLWCKQNHLDAIIAIGTVIEGETRHFDFVCEGVTQGIMQLNIEYDTPVIFCVLTDQNIEQSRARSGGKHGNKGVECAVAAIKMAELRRREEVE